MKKPLAPVKKQSGRAHGHDINPADVLANAPTKASRVLAYLLMPGRSLNRFEALSIGDSCLPSTISAFSNTHGLAFERVSEQVPNNWGSPCPVTRYRLPESQHKQALALLALMVSKARKRAPVGTP